MAYTSSQIDILSYKWSHASTGGKRPISHLIQITQRTAEPLGAQLLLVYIVIVVDACTGKGVDHGGNHCERKRSPNGSKKFQCVVTGLGQYGCVISKGQSTVESGAKITEIG